MYSYWTILIVIVIGLIAYRYNRRVVAAVRDFEARNRARILQQESDKHDQLAHYRHTAGVADEQIEEISEIDALDMRLGTKVKRYVFDGELYATRDEAEAARMRAVVEKARNYYKELPAALAARSKDRLH